MTGSTRKTTGTIIAISLRPPASSSARLPGLADVGGLGPQHLGQRRAALDRDGDAVDEPGQRRQAGPVAMPLQRGDQRHPGAGLGEGPAELARTARRWRAG